MRFIQPVINLFIRLGINPNHLTTLGFLIQLGTIYFLAKGHLFISGWLILLAGTCDILDGQVARARGVGTKFGSLYDSTIDRYSEFAMFFGIGWYFIYMEFYWSTVGAFLALGGSLMTSYIRARSEGLGFDCKVGYMQRPERIVYIGSACIFSEIPVIGEYTLIVVLWFIAAMANLTAYSRLKHVFDQTDRGRELLETDEKREQD
ncbi:CDP-alcohol phosphatidyltransferase family protein [candidate division KSB1 bacterium]